MDAVLRKVDALRRGLLLVALKLLLVALKVRCRGDREDLAMRYPGWPLPR